MTRDETLGGVLMYVGPSGNGYTENTPGVARRPGVWLSAEHAARVARVVAAAVEVDFLRSIGEKQALVEVALDRLSAALDEEGT